MPLSASDDLVKAALTLLARLGQKEGENQLVIKDPALKMGFMVDLMGGAVRLDFTDEAFIAQFTEQLSPEFWKFFQAVQLQHEDGK
jgi:hypothetical protein